MSGQTYHNRVPLQPVFALGVFLMRPVESARRHRRTLPDSGVSRANFAGFAFELAPELQS